MIEVPELALSMIQPMGTALVKGWKPIENRKWKPWPKIIGKMIAIHASAKWDDDYARFIDRLMMERVAKDRWFPAPRGEHAQSAIIGVVRVLTSVDKITNLQDTRDRAWFTGPHGWLVMGARELARPIPCKGSLALWRIPDHERGLLAQQLAEAA